MNVRCKIENMNISWMNTIESLLNNIKENLFLVVTLSWTSAAIVVVGAGHDSSCYGI